MIFGILLKCEGEVLFDIFCWEDLLEFRMFLKIIIYQEILLNEKNYFGLFCEFS